MQGKAKYPSSKLSHSQTALGSSAHLRSRWSDWAAAGSKHTLQPRRPTSVRLTK